jgi:hypothetical protein
MEKNERVEGALSRRGFLAGAGAVAIGASMTGMIGCQQDPQQAASSGTNGANSAAIDEHISPGMRATATLENAEPIPPENPPAEWTAEADIVVVGTGGGGLAAALLASEKGASVIAVEKNSTPGGATQHANGLANIAGLGRDQIARGYSTPEFPYVRENFLRWLEPNYQFTADTNLLGNVVEAAGECFDWLQDRGADIVLSKTGRAYMPRVVFEGKIHKVLSMRQLTDQFHLLGVDAGVEYHFNTPCSALITEDDRVVGIKATGSDGDVYFKANKGVILCSGGIGMNPDMLKKYIPTAYENSVIGGPMPYHTGEVTRMAMGAGADISGIDSWCSWESELDNDTGEWIYFWGVRQITQLPWLNIDILGERCAFYEWNEFGDESPVYYQDSIPYATKSGDKARHQVQASRIGHRAYCIFDSLFEDYLPDLVEPIPGEKHPIDLSIKIPEQDLFDPDWHVEFQKALDDGRMKQADTLEELAEKLGMEPQVLVDAVAKWNDNCEKGEDSGTLYPYQKSFLNPIVEPPFFGAKIGPRLGKTLAGVRVDPELRVRNAKGKVIPGLYANFTTAGGVTGESTYGTSLVGTSVLGGCGLSWASGYLAARTAMSD